MHNQMSNTGFETASNRKNFQKPQTPKNSEKKTSQASNNSYKAYISALEHASTCSAGSNCKISHCTKIKILVKHECTEEKNGGQNSNNGQNSETCKNCVILQKLVNEHVKFCESSSCSVPFCSEIRREAAVVEARTQLKLILHARSCKKGEFCEQICTVAKEVISHARYCRRLDENCGVPYCLNVKQLIQHYNSCVRSDCSICDGLEKNKVGKKADDKLENSLKNKANAKVENTDITCFDDCESEDSRTMYVENMHNIRWRGI